MITIRADGRVYQSKKYLGLVRKVGGYKWAWQLPGGKVGGNEFLRRDAIAQLKAYAH